MVNVFGMQSATLRDCRGYTSVLKFVGTNDNLTDLAGSCQDQVNDFAALSNAALVTAHGPYSLEPSFVPSYGAQADYRDVEDGLILTWGCVDGQLVRVRIPAPKTAIFLADGRTLNQANALVVTALSHALTGGVGGIAVIASIRTHSPIQTFINGFRKRNRNDRRRIANLTKAADATTPASP